MTTKTERVFYDTRKAHWTYFASNKDKNAFHFQASH
jgi:hypothetical protein